jgi:hypothetical protein
MGMDSLSPSLLEEMNSYLQTCAHTQQFNAALKHKKAICKFLTAAIYSMDIEVAPDEQQLLEEATIEGKEEEDLGTDTPYRDRSAAAAAPAGRRQFPHCVLEAIRKVLGPDALSESDHVDLFFVLLVEHCHMRLVAQLRHLVRGLLIDKVRFNVFLAMQCCACIRIDVTKGMSIFACSCFVLL